MLGEINILFGEVVDINDSEKLFRCRVSINGYTDEIETEDLPWYYPFGIKKLPEIGDTVGVIIFDQVITSGFYTDSINLKVNIDDNDYLNYVELFNKDFDGTNAKLTFKESKGIELVYGDSSLNVTKEKSVLASGSSEVEVTDDKIKLGTKAEEPVLLGQKTIDLLSDVIDVVTEISKEFSNSSLEMNTWMTACGTPFTAAMAPTVLGIMSSMTSISAKVQTLKVKLDTLKSNKVLTE